MNLNSCFWGFVFFTTKTFNYILICKNTSQQTQICFRLYWRKSRCGGAGEGGWGGLGEHKERRGKHRISAALRGVISVQQIELITALSQLAFPHSAVMNIMLSQKAWPRLPDTGCLTDMPAILKISALYKFTSHHCWLLAFLFSLFSKRLLAQSVLVF